MLSKYNLKTHFPNSTKWSTSLISIAEAIPLSLQTIDVGFQSLLYEENNQG
jgi:hypothetical protein